MKTTIKKIFLLLFSFLIANISYAQIENGKLEIGKTKSFKTNSDEKHFFTLDLKKDQFVFLKVMQKGVDLQITSYDTNGDEIGDFDSPNGTNGPEMIQFTSTDEGIYKIAVYPLNNDAVKGDYDITLVTVKPKAKSKNDKVDEAFFIWNQMDGPGAAVAIQKDGVILYKKGYGLANLEYDIPVDPTTVFHIASVSKQFTAYSILLLEAEGKLSIDDDIRKYIPEVPDFGKTITLKHLVTHTSGMRDQWNLLAMAGWRLDDVITKEHVLKLVSKQKDLNFDPGEEMVYCNTGFTLLAEVVARVSEQTFAEFTEERIFGPLQMSNTLFYDDHQKIVKNRAYSYYSDDKGYKKSVLSYANVGATSLFTTVEDLSMWANNFSTIKVGNKEIIESMNTRAILNNGDTISAAKGQFVGEYKGLKEISHGGADAGYRSFLTRFPDENFSVAVFGNAASFNPGALAHKVVDIYLKDQLEDNKEEEEQTEEETTEVESIGTVALSSELLDAYVGDYELQPGFMISISQESGALFAQATGQQKLSLGPISETEFKVKGVEATVHFIPNNEAKVQAIKLHQGGRIMDAARLADFDKSKVNLDDFTGEFYSDELSTSYHFKIKEGKLIAAHSRLSDIELTPSKKDFFSGNQWFFGQVDFKRDENGVVNSCEVSSGRVRNLKFTKIK